MILRPDGVYRGPMASDSRDAIIGSPAHQTPPAAWRLPPTWAHRYVDGYSPPFRFPPLRHASVSTGSGAIARHVMERVSAGMGGVSVGMPVPRSGSHLAAGTNRNLVWGGVTWMSW